MSNEELLPQPDIDHCMAEITRFLPAIATRHSPLALLIALAEHVGAGLQLSLATGSCTPEQARAALKQLDGIAFRLHE